VFTAAAVGIGVAGEGSPVVGGRIAMRGVLRRRRRQARISLSAARLDFSAYSSVEDIFLCPNRFRTVSTGTPPLMSSVA
jgi:hypothetical protein